MLIKGSPGVNSSRYILSPFRNTKLLPVSGINQSCKLRSEDADNVCINVRVSPAKFTSQPAVFIKWLYKNRLRKPSVTDHRRGPRRAGLFLLWCQHHKNQRKDGGDHCKQATEWVCLSWTDYNDSNSMVGEHGVLPSSPAGLKIVASLPAQNESRITDDNFKCNFVNEIWLIPIFFQWSLYVYPLGEPTTCHYLNQRWPSSTKHLCSTRGRWVNDSRQHTYRITANKQTQFKTVREEGLQSVDFFDIRGFVFSQKLRSKMAPLRRYNHICRQSSGTIL